MQAFGKALGRILLVLILTIAALWWFGPREAAPLSASFDPASLSDGVQAHFDAQEAAFEDITPGTEKRVIWQDGFADRRTPVSILYIHGFSASSEEIRPVPDRVADALGANLVYTRLQGHGRSGAALGEATVAGWMADVAEGLAAARTVGEAVVVMSTSTGGTLAAAAALDPDLSADVAAMVFVSPNFGVNQTGDFLMTWPAARTWLPWLIGSNWSFEPANAEQEKFWTVSYPTKAILPMAAIVEAVVQSDFSAATVPALFWFSPDDRVVRPDKTRAVAEAWGGPMMMREVTMGPGDDPYSHVVAGAILSPGQTDMAVEGMLEWLETVLP